MHRCLYPFVAGLGPAIREKRLVDPRAKPGGGRIEGV